MMKNLLVILLLIMPLSCLGKAMGAFTVNGVKISELVFEKLWQQADAQKSITREAFRAKLVESLLLSEYALTHYPQLNQATNVGYDPQLTQRLQVNRVLLNWFKFDSAQTKKAAKNYISFALDVDTLNEAIGKPSMLGYELDKAQRERAQRVIVATIHLPNGEIRHINLAQLYDEQSVQGRMAFHQGDVNVVKKYCYDRFFVMWHRYAAVQRADFSRQDLMAIEAIVKAKFLEPALMLHLGAISSEHGNNDGLKSFKSKVSKAQIKAFYQANLKDFEHVSAAKAYLLRFDEQKQAQKVFAELKEKDNWQKVASQLGQSGYFPGHDNGWVEVADDNKWLPTLAFALPEGKVNPPIRGPKGQWYLVKVLQRRTDFYKPDSDTVMFQATNAIARIEAQKAFGLLKQQLVDSASITYYEKQ